MTTRHAACLVLAFLTILMGCEDRPAPEPRGDRVVLLHGLGRTDRSMTEVEAALTSRGYRVTNLEYPSTDHRIQHLSNVVLDSALAACCPDGTVHFVTHSMGGIVLRYYLERHELDRLGRVVMLSPPNQGSEVADWAAGVSLADELVGPALEQLRTDPNSLANQLGPADFPLGVITGDRTWNPFYSGLIPGEDDGKISVQRAKVDGMQDFLVVPHSHTFIMYSDAVIAQVLHFLEHGYFRREGADTPRAR